MVHFLMLAVGAGLTAGLFLGSVLSCFVVAVMVSSQQYKSAGNFMILQLCAVDFILSLLGLALSAPSLLQGQWLIAEGDSDLRPSFSVTIPEGVAVAKSTGILTVPPTTTTSRTPLHYNNPLSLQPLNNKYFAPGSGLEIRDIGPDSGLDIDGIATTSELDIGNVATGSGLDIDGIGTGSRLEIGDTATGSGLEISDIATGSGLEIGDIDTGSGLNYPVPNLRLDKKSFKTPSVPQLSKDGNLSAPSLIDDDSFIVLELNNDDVSIAPSLSFNEATTLPPLQYEDISSLMSMDTEVTTTTPAFSFWDYVISTDIFSQNDDSTVVPRHNANSYQVAPDFDTENLKAESEYKNYNSEGEPKYDPRDFTVNPSVILATSTVSPNLKYDNTAPNEAVPISQLIFDDTEASSVLKYDSTYDYTPSDSFSNSDSPSPGMKLSRQHTSSEVRDLKSLSDSRLMKDDHETTARRLSHSINFQPRSWGSNILSSATPSESQLYTSSEDYRKNYNDSVKNLLADGAKDYNPFEKRPESGNYVISSQLLHVSGKDDGVSCRLYGGILSLLNLVGVWIVVGIHCDKYCAIASPLRYNQIVTRKRIAVFSLSVWTFSFAVSVTLMVVAPNFKYLGGVCLPVFDNAGKVIYTSCLLVVFILSPAAIFLLVNGKILFIARQHQHRIFSAIFEVMMSAQATVTQQRNPFDMPKMKQKSAWAICEQLISFAVCYCPIVLFLFLECAVHYPINNFLTVVMVGSVLLAPVVNTFLYGIKSATIRKILKNYLRKKISRSAMKCEIQARIPSAQNSRRPSISSTLGFPAIHRSLQRRMSDYLRPDHMPETDSRELVRRSSELSWHPLEEGTPTSSRLRQPMDLDFASDWNPSQVTSASQYLAVPSYEAARCQTSNLRSSSSTESIGTFSMKEPTTEDEFIVTSAEISPAFQNKILTSNKTTEVVRPLVYPFPEDDALRTNGNIRNTISVSMPLYRKGSSTLSSVLSEDPQSATPATPLLCKAYMTPWPKTETSQSTSPYILRTLESLVSVGISQSRLMKSTSFWKGFGFDKESSGNNNNNSLDSLDPGLSVELNEKYKCFEIMIGESVASFPEEETELTEEFPSVIA